MAKQPQTPKLCQASTSELPPLQKAVLIQKAVLTIPEAAQYLTISVRAFYNLKSRGLIRTFKIGRRCCVLLRDLEALVERLVEDEQATWS